MISLYLRPNYRRERKWNLNLSKFQALSWVISRDVLIKPFPVPTSDVVIAVPANFNDYQRRATKDAALIADLNPIDVISEPVAASITYAYYSGYKEEERNILIYDFGGGTLDVALVNIKGGTFTVKATAGDSHFGGSDIDQYLCDKQIEKIKIKYGIDIPNSTMATFNNKYSRIRSIILDECEKAKKAITSGNTLYEFEIPGLVTDDKGESINIRAHIAKSEFENFVDEKKNELLDPVRLVITQSGIDKSKIAALILVGGSSRIPKVKEMVGNEVGQEPYTPLNPDSAIAQGGAIYCAYRKLASEGKSLPGFKKFEIKEITPMGIGIGTIYRTVEHALPRNSPIPVQSVWQRFVYKHRGFSLSIPTISLNVYEGDSTKDSECHHVGKFEVEIPKEDKRELIPIYTRISVNKEGITLEAILSDDEPEESDKIRKLYIKSDKAIHSSEEITNLKNQCKVIIIPVPPIIPAPNHIKLYEIVNNCSRNMKKAVEQITNVPIASKSIINSIKEFINQFKKEKRIYNEYNPISDELFEKFQNDLKLGLDNKLAGLYDVLKDLSNKKTTP